MSTHYFDSRGLLHCPYANKASRAKERPNGKTYTCRSCSRVLKLAAPIVAAPLVEVSKGGH